MKRKRGKEGGGKARRSRYVGVSWKQANQKWRAKITVAGVEQHLGYFDDEADGARAYDAAVTTHNLERPRNLPDGVGAAVKMQAAPKKSRLS